ncbi:diguanylate cyclase [Pseudomonas sp. HR96]|uniref:sensor domain-containing diguanylate cyclase n=1 Tax=Pseudomonas sp. HR96 TaxID=1027966 RepID=UPI002A75E1DE|nr:diguanylate cyclase [Pseudomonas sp. HR96]WPO98074.1 diguanylate cyclase [Pseudomonas sp. HR96]
MAAVASKTKVRGASMPRRVYAPRCVGLTLGFIAVYFNLLPGASYGSVLGLLIGYCFVWPHLAFLASRRSCAPMRAEYRNLFIDALAVGFFAGAMGCNPLPSVAIVTMIGMNNMAAGGLRLLLQGGAVSLFGLAIAWLGLQPGAVGQPSAGQVNACLPLLVLYPMSLGYVCFITTSKLARHKDQLDILSRTDHLTGLTNRKALNDLLEAQFAGEPGECVVALVDVDHFKQINDRHGHLAGDQVLARISRVMLECVREHDTVARYGGDEFCVILRQVDETQAEQILERMRCLAAQMDTGLGVPLRPTLSIGAALHHPRALNSVMWLNAADTALYRAKREGRNRVAFAG